MLFKKIEIIWGKIDQVIWLQNNISSCKLNSAATIILQGGLWH